jgi:subtilisin family serine protease
MSGADMDAFVATRTDRAHLNPGQTGVAKFNVTADVQAFLTGAANHGWLLTAADPTSRAVVWSRETAVKPRLVLSVDRNDNAEPVPAQAPESDPGAYPESRLIRGSPTLSGTFVRDVLIVLFTPEATQQQRQSAIDQVQGTVIGGTRLTDTDGFYIVKIPDTGSEAPLFDALEALEALPHVVRAQPEMILEDAALYQRPNDGFGFQKADWSLTRTGQPDLNWAMEDIRAPLAWGCSTGDNSTAVAVVDLGIWGGNSDLSPVSMFHGNLHVGPDLNTHGMRVASVLAAGGGNNVGITGMMWKSSLRLYSIEQDDGTGHAITWPSGFPWYTTKAMANRISRAGREGARVINLSMGKQWPNIIPGTPADSNWVRRQAEILGDGIAAAGPQPLIVIAAGNAEGTPPLDAFWAASPQVHTRFPNQVIVVGASDSTGEHLADFSFRGPLVDVAAPGVKVASLTGFGDLPQFDRGTSFAAPLVSGLAGLLLSFDSRLTAQQVKQLIVDGATVGGRTADGVPIIDAYESLKLAGQHEGAPLCGNRIWAEGGTVYANRVTGPEPLFAAEGGERGVFGLAAHHGGREIDMIAWSGPDRTFTLRGTEWLRSPETPNLFTNQSGVANSLWGLSHDGDKEVFIDNRAFDNSRILRMKLFDSSTGNITFTSVDTVLAQLQQYPETTCAWRSGGTCSGIGRGTNDEYMLPWAVAYSPLGDHAVLAVSVHRTIATFNGDWKPCPWSVPDPETGNPSDECLDSITNEKLPVKADLFDFPLPSGQPRLITTLENTVVNSITISEDGTQMIVNEGMKREKYDALPPGPEGCFPNTPGVFGFCVEANRTESTVSCMITYRSLATGAILEPKVSARYACDLPVGTTAAVKAKGAMRTRSMMHRP